MGEVFFFPSSTLRGGGGVCLAAGAHGRLSPSSRLLPAATARCCRVPRLSGTGRAQEGVCGAWQPAPPRQHGQHRTAHLGDPPASLSPELGARSHGVRVHISAGRAGPEVSPERLSRRQGTADTLGNAGWQVRGRVPTVAYGNRFLRRTATLGLEDAAGGCIPVVWICKPLLSQGMGLGL